MLLEGALFSVFATIGDPEGGRDELAPALVAFGVVLALHWAWISALTAARINTWRNAVRHVEAKVDGVYQLFHETEQHRAAPKADGEGPAGHRRRRSWKGWWKNPTAVAQLLPYAVALMWGVAALLRYG